VSDDVGVPPGLAEQMIANIGAEVGHTGWFGRATS
jgi:hypothetical protein